MTSRKMSFFEFWSRKKERGALLKRANQLRLLPSQLTQLLGDSGVRAELQNGRLVSLLPPVGTEVFRRFSPASLGEIQQRHEAEEKEPKKKKKNKERAKKDLPKPSSDLEAGKPLPFIYGDPPPELLNTPLEELDPYYQSQKTFIVLSKGNVIHRFNAEPACNLLSPFNLLRTVAIKILIHSLFRWFIMVTILTNCMLMTLSTPPAWTKTVEYVFTAIYTFEALIKVVSRGFCVTNFTFLRDPWNWLDVMVVSMAYVAQFVGLWKFSVLSTVPRVLKLITVIPGLRTTVVAFVQSVKRLAHVAVLTVFWLSIFSMIALQIFMGSLRQKCIIMPWHRNLTSDFTLADYYFNETGNPDFEFDSYISSPVNQYHLPGHLNALLCGNRSDAGVCSDGYTCIKGGRNPNYGFTNYDSFGWSFLSVFRLMTEDYCEDLIEMTLRAAGKVNMIFFIAIAPGCFFLLSLLLAVVVMTFSEQEEDSVAEAKQKEEEFRQILDALKKREEEEQAACRAAPSEIQNGENKKSPEHIPMEEFEKDQRSCSPCWSVFAGLFLKWNCCGCWRWLKQRLYAFITNPFFDLGIVVCLVLHTLYISMEHFPMSMWFEWHLTVADMVFTAIFTAEMIIKIVALDPYGYFQVGWNVFDCIIVTFSLLDLCLADFNLFYKLMRVIRLARWWPSFHMFLKLIWTSVRALRNVTLLPLITVFIFTVVGVQLFGTDYKECVCRISADCELPRWHMNDFFHSFLLIFRILCGEWIETLWDCMEVAGQTTCLIFFMMVVVIGNLLVLNLFLTLLLSSFSDDSLEAKNMEKNNLQIAISRIKTWTVEHICRRKKKHHVNPDNTGGKEYLALNLTSDQSLSEVKDLSGNLGNLADKHRNIESGRAPLADIEIELKTPENEEEKKFDDVEKHPEVQKNENDEDHRQNTPEDCCSARCYSCCPFLDIDTSQGAGRVWSNFRRACFTITQHINFEAFMIVIILLSSSALVYEDIHLQQREILRAVVERADQVFTFLFLLEMLLKWIAFGLKKYFTSGWCWFDFLILSVSLVSLTADTFGFLALGAFQSLRTLRALMPLRIVSRFQGLRVVVLTLLRTVPYMFDGLLVLLTVWLMFSILGVNMFAGKFYYCLNHTTWEMFPRDEVNNMSDCLSLNHPDVIWVRRELDFDSVSRGYLSLLHLASSNEWLDVMYSAMDSTEVEGQPDFEANMSMSLYFICFIIIGCFFSFIFFIRGIINKLQTDKIRKHIFMTERQQKYSKVLKKLFFKKPQKLVPRPQNRCQAGLFDLVTKPCFEVFMVVVICLNLVTLMLETDSMSHQTDVILYWIHMVFILIFLTEFIVKIIALRKYYFKDRLNVLDFVVIIFSIGGLFITDLLEKYFVSPFFFPMLRVARISRVLHLSRFTRGIKRSLPAIFNIGILLVLLMVTFSIFGMFNFAYVKRVFMINDMYNFETFWNSMICLFTITTSPAWSGVVSSIMSTPPNCDPDLENPGSTVRGDCGSPAAAIFFLVSYIALPFLLVIYLYIAVVLGTFNSEDTEPLSDDDLRMFSKTWRQFDPDASQLIQYSKLSDFCDTLQDPLRIPKPNTIKLIHMDLPLLPGDTIHCSDVFLALAAQVLDDSEAMDTLKTRMEEKFMAYSSKVSSEPISSTLRRKQEEQAALVIQRAYRKCLLQQRDAEESAAQPLNGVGGVSSVAGTSLPPTLN